MRSTADIVVLRISDPNGVKSGVCTMHHIVDTIPVTVVAIESATRKIASAGKSEAIREVDRTPVFNIYIKLIAIYCGRCHLLMIPASPPSSTRVLRRAFK
jgi:hypothetical protein